MDRSNLLGRNRQKIINRAAQLLENANDSRVADMIARYCRKRDIPATDRDIQDMASEAIRRRMVAKIKQLQSQLIALNDKVNNFHP